MQVESVYYKWKPQIKNLYPLPRHSYRFWFFIHIWPSTITIKRERKYFTKIYINRWCLLANLEGQKYRHYGQNRVRKFKCRSPLFPKEKGNGLFKFWYITSIYDQPKCNEGTCCVRRVITVNSYGNIVNTTVTFVATWVILQNSFIFHFISDSCSA